MVRSHTHAQHFLSGPRLVAELIGHSNIRKNDVVYDLGAGSGVIASTLAPRCKKVIAVEIEPQALTKLRQNVTGFENIEIIKQDILKVSPPTGPYKIFSNIPFHLTSDIIRKFVFGLNPPKSIYLIVQKQFARKLVPGDDHFTSQLSAEIGPLFTVRIRKPLRKTDFTPPPAVDTVLIELKLREVSLIQNKEISAYRDLVEKSFSNQKFFGTLQKPFSPELRPSQLTGSQWLELFNTLRRTK